MSEWQDISTAPRDGSAVILCCAIDGDGEPINWLEDISTAGVFVQIASWSALECWGHGSWVVYCSLVQDPELHFIPTHWMPLPAPPVVTP